MKRNLSRFVFLLFFTLFAYPYGNASNVKGYIINLSQDTVYGTIQLPKFNHTTEAYYLKGYDAEYITHKIKFKKNDGKSFRLLGTDSLLGYGFVYHSSTYYYRRFFLKYESIFAKTSGEYRFLNLAYDGAVDLYVNTRFLNMPTANHYEADFPTYNEYYLFDESTGLVRVEGTDNVKSVQDLLSKFNVNSEFIKTLPRNIEFKNILMILEKYDEWLSVSGKR